MEIASLCIKNLRIRGQIFDYFISNRIYFHIECFENDNYELDINSYSEVALKHSTIFVDIVSVHLHPGYSPDNVDTDDDIALIKIKPIGKNNHTDAFKFHRLRLSN